MLVFGLDPRPVAPHALELASKVVGPCGQYALVQFEHAARVYLEDDVRERAELEETLEKELVLVEASRRDRRRAQHVSNLVGERAIPTSLAIERVRLAFSTFYS